MTFEMKKMEQKMTLEEYKKKVEDFLNKNSNDSTGTMKLMKEYEDDLPKFLADGWEPEVAATAMVMGY